MGKRTKTTAYRLRFSDLRGMRLPALCVFFALGAVLGHVTAQLLGGDSELAAQLRSYALLEADESMSASLFSVAALYLRYPLLVLFLGFCSFGIGIIPLVLSVQGFTFSFAAALMGASLGWQGAVLALACFGLRSILTLASTLLLALWSMERSLGSERTQRSSGRIIILCFLLLAVGITLELTVVPKLFSLALSMLK